MPPIVLSIAGFDPSSGAGITADIKTIAAHECYGVSCITAYTVQSTQGVRSVHPLSSELVRDTLEELASDVEISAVRVGMLGSAEVAATVANFLCSSRLPNVVLDPIVTASSGANLVGSQEAFSMLRTRLLPLSTVVTPNLAEASTLTGLKVTTIEEMKSAAVRLREIGAANAVVTGGHLQEPADVLSTADGIEVFHASHIPSQSTHGTGCAFATSVACNLANGLSVKDAVLAAGNYVRQAIAEAYLVGKGIGPLNHLYRFTI